MVSSKVGFAHAISVYGVVAGSSLLLLLPLFRLFLRVPLAWLLLLPLLLLVASAIALLVLCLVKPSLQKWRRAAAAAASLVVAVFLAPKFDRAGDYAYFHTHRDTLERLALNAPAPDDAEKIASFERQVRASGFYRAEVAKGYVALTRIALLDDQEGYLLLRTGSPLPAIGSPVLGAKLTLLRNVSGRRYFFRAG